MNGMFRFSPCRTSAGVPETIVETVLVFHSPVEGRKNGNGCQSGTQGAATHGVGNGTSPDAFLLSRRVPSIHIATYV